MAQSGSVMELLQKESVNLSVCMRPKKNPRPRLWKSLATCGSAPPPLLQKRQITSTSKPGPPLCRSIPPKKKTHSKMVGSETDRNHPSQKPPVPTPKGMTASGAASQRSTASDTFGGAKPRRANPASRGAGPSLRWHHGNLLQLQLRGQRHRHLQHLRRDRQLRSPQLVLWRLGWPGEDDCTS